MPLVSIQRDIATLLAPNRSASSHLAGALHLAPDSPRSSEDLDYFHEDLASVAKAFESDRRLLEKSGYRVEVQLSQPGFIRAIVGREDGTTKVDWVHDSAWRFFPPLPDPQVGFRLHPIDLAVNKVLALSGRDEPRDFLDVIHVHEHLLSLGALCWAAVGKDPGYNPESLVETLARKGRYHPGDFAALRLASPDLVKLKGTWLRAIDEARHLAGTLPPEDAGCLYLDPVEGNAVSPSGDTRRLRRHFGTHGGILPSIGRER
ncbi:MAG TPA: hypothetical protein VGG34_08800 [Opitutaceae bacterium]|jgi:hypothetical protein